MSLSPIELCGFLVNIPAKILNLAGGGFLVALGRTFLSNMTGTSVSFSKFGYPWLLQLPIKIVLTVLDYFVTGYSFRFLVLGDYPIK